LVLAKSQAARFFRGALAFFGFADASTALLEITRPISPNDALKTSRCAASQ
jgi:hypothetical protein